MALKFVHKKDTELQDFLSEYCIALTLGAHPCIATALGIAFQTPQHYVFAQELALAHDLFSLMVPKVSTYTRLREIQAHAQPWGLQLVSLIPIFSVEGHCGDE